MEQPIDSEASPLVKQLVALGYIEERVRRMRHLLTLEKIEFLFKKKGVEIVLTPKSS